ncbi:MAG TPA: hypothetical protein VLC95_15935 [Anaerolineae bacterium]|nr:hypothetical protein [Anaerolineae bacterium]
MSDKLLAAGASVDWISPLLAMLGNLVNGPSYTFLIPYDCGWSGRDVISLLRRNGIKTWGHMVVSDTLMLTVRLAQAGWAQYLLDRAAIPVENRTTAAPQPASAPIHSPGGGRETENRFVTTAKKLWDLELF